MKTATAHFSGKVSPSVLKEIQDLLAEQSHKTANLVRIGIALSAEKNLDNLLEMIVDEARQHTHADGGTLYLMSADKRMLDFTIIQNDSLNVRMGGQGEALSWPPVPLETAAGAENHANACAHCALAGKLINIADVYTAEGFDFQGTRDFDRTTGYRSRSMLLVPLRNHEDEVIGVLQLLNCRKPRTSQVIAFPQQIVPDIASLASQAAIAVTNTRLIRDLENLFHAFLQAIATAIDEKSPYTAGHVARVASLSESLARLIGQDSGEPRQPYSEQEIQEIKLAAWMHDIGKIATPEFIIDKATKLETIFDRIELVRLRAEILKRDLEIAELKNSRDPNRQLLPDQGAIEAALALVERNNAGQHESLDRLQELTQVSLRVNGNQVPFLSADEYKNLAIRAGTLTTEEREIINNHVRLTIKMLEKLPFPPKLQQVPTFAGMHHEKLDGSGYPRGLGVAEIPLPARILAIADVFEAMTAADRPYKPSKKLSEAVRILEFMAEDGHLDSELCDLFVSSGVLSDYARRVLPREQCDGFSWRGHSYQVD
jgi:HD-GYP domain-containing protein (c-di-GMP phosphodiesterase class II)